MERELLLHIIITLLIMVTGFAMSEHRDTALEARIEQLEADQ